MLIGLTGGIGAGKSTVSNYLIEKGYPVLDADKVAREIVEPGTETLKKLADVFGKDIINLDGSLNRAGLAKIVFSDPEKKERLDEIMHDKVIEILLSRAKKIIQPIVFIDVPLLYESGMDKYVDQVWLVDAHEEIRIERVVDRDGSKRSDVEKRMFFQMDSEEKISKSHVVLDNSKDKEYLYTQINDAINSIRENNS